MFTDYDEDRELTRYVWDYFASLMTAFEREAGLAILARTKLNLDDKRVYDTTNSAVRNWGRFDNPEINAALADGFEAFRRRVRDRVLLTEAWVATAINRCPACRRVVRTPQARQCFWCGFDWHP